MKRESLETLELKLLQSSVQSAPVALRQAVLRGVQRELAAARWDRKVARVTVLLLMLGVGMNASLGLPWPQPAGRQENQQYQLAGERSCESLVETAVHVAEATDEATGRRFARHLAEVAGWTLTVDELLAIDVAIQRRSVQSMWKDG